MKIYLCELLAMILIIEGFGLQWACASSKETWVTTNSVVTSEKLRALTEKSRETIQDGNFISSFEAQLRQPVSESKMADFLQAEMTAHNALASGDLTQASILYGRLIDLLEKAPLVFGLEKIMLSALINRAEIATLTKETTAENWWQRAHAWSPAASISLDEFSPTVVTQFAHSGSKNLKNLTIISWNDSLVYIDGRLTPFSSEVFSTKVEEGPHQIAVLAPGTSWLTKMIVVTENLRMELRPKLLVGGKCDSPDVLANPFTAEISKSQRMLVLFDEGCPRVVWKNKIFSVNGDPINDFKGASEISGQPTANSNTGEVGGSSTTSPPQELKMDSVGGTNRFVDESRAQEEDSSLKKLTRSPWFWGGVGVVVTAGAWFLVNSAQQNGRSGGPTQTVQ